MDQVKSIKNVAIVVAGGSGTRMGQDIPKQFINVFDKPVLIYTLESFQRHPDIDAIEVVCIEGWETMVEAYANLISINSSGLCVVVQAYRNPSGMVLNISSIKSVRRIMSLFMMAFVH